VQSGHCVAGCAAGYLLLVQGGKDFSSIATFMTRFGVGDMQQSADKVVEVIHNQVCASGVGCILLCCCVDMCCCAGQRFDNKRVDQWHTTPVLDARGGGHTGFVPS
jgi:hypothetical protein